jgi:hypothetical protein
MTKSQEELIKLKKEVNQLSAEIDSMKCKANRMDGGTEKDKLLREIKDKQFQVLFYIEKMNNISDRKQE